MTVFWYCRNCIFAAANGEQAFLHRSVDEKPTHHVVPLTSEEASREGLPPVWSGTGIEKHFAMEDVVLDEDRR